MKKKAIFFLVFSAHFLTFSQEKGKAKNIGTENFVVRAFTYSRVHYFARLSYNNQTIYINNIIHPHKSLIIFSNPGQGIKTLDFSYDENFLVVGTNSGIINIWDINKRSLFKTIDLHKGGVNRVKFLNNKMSFISIGNDGKLFWVDITEDSDHILLGEHDGVIRDFDLSSDENQLVTIGSDGILVLWNLQRKEKIKSVIIDGFTPSKIRFLKGSNDILVGDVDGTLSLYDEMLNLKKNVKVHKNIISSICILSKEEFITCSFDGSIKKVKLQDFSSNTLYFNKSYIISSVIKNDVLTFSKRNGELLSIKLKL